VTSSGISGAGYSMSLARGVPGHFFGAWQVEAFLPLVDFTAMMDDAAHLPRRRAGR
jgi:hypothetical protein